MWWLIRFYLKRFSRFKDIQVALQERREFESNTREQIRAYQLAQFNELWQFACSEVPYYRTLKQQLSLPSQFESLEVIAEQVPLLEKTTIQLNPNQLLPDCVSGGFWTGTSGSTGTPMKCYWDNLAYIESQRDKYYCQSLWDIDVWDKTANLWGYTRFLNANLEGKIKFFKVRIMEKIRNKMAFPVYQIDRAKLREWYRQLDQKKIKFLYALPNLAYLLAKANQDQPPPQTLKLVMTGGEPLFPYQKKVIEDVLGPVAIEYGAIETGLIAASYPDSNLHICERGVLLETLPTQDGMFELVITNLRNKSFPLIRYRLGDLVNSAISFPGRGTAILGDVIGRVRDVFISDSGQIINGVILSEFFREFANVLQYQVVQESISRVVVRLASLKPLTSSEKQIIQTKLSQLLGPKTVIHLHEVAEIQATAAAKQRFIISNVAQDQLDSLIDAGPATP